MGEAEDKVASTVSRVTIHDVAAAAAVSIKTVSRVINREPNVRPAVQARVEAAIGKLGYVPNTAARSLAGARSFVIGAIFDNPNPHYIIAVQRGAMAACRQVGYHLAIEEIDTAGNVAAQMRAMLTTARLDGVILSPPVTDCAAVLDALNAKNIPYVRLMPATPKGRSHVIISDDAAAASEVARHLWDLGHRRFAVITGPAGHSASSLRLDGFRAGIIAAGGDATQTQVIKGDFTFHSGMAAGLALFAEKSHPTAIFASNDDMAAGIYSAAAQSGLRIPEDISVVGYDDSPVAELVWPPLTTVRQPVAEMAAEAARLLIEGRGNEVPYAVELPYKMIMRGSTGAKPRTAN